MFTIEINSESIIFDDVLKYSATFNNVNDFTTDGLIYNQIYDDEKNKYLVKLKLGFGNYKIQYHDSPIVIEYSIDKNNPVGLSHVVKCKENLRLVSMHSSDHLQDFIKDAYNYCRPKSKNLVEISTFKNYWTKLNKLPLRDIETVYLDKDVKDNIVKDIGDFFNDEDVYKLYGIPYKKTYLFEGIPGTGKSSLIFALASKFKMNICIFSFGPDVDDAIFMKAISTLPENSILLLEDVDALFVQRESKVKSYITFSGILNTLDGVARRHKLITFLTTNYVKKLDSALIRPGRIDYIVTFTYATKYQINMMFKKFRPDDNTFDEFYKKIENRKYTTAILQKFFFSNRLKDNILDKVNELEEIKNIHADKNADSEPPEFMYL